MRHITSTLSNAFASPRISSVSCSGISSSCILELASMKSTIRYFCAPAVSTLLTTHRGCASEFSIRPSLKGRFRNASSRQLYLLVTGKKREREPFHYLFSRIHSIAIHSAPLDHLFPLCPLPSTSHLAQFSVS